MYIPFILRKTMKWWSDCTSNWREKWCKVRNERNQAREENKQLRANMEAAMKESHSYKREKQDLELQITQLKKEMEKIHLCLMKHAGNSFFYLLSLFHYSNWTSNCIFLDQHREPDVSGSPIDQLSNDGLKNVNSEDGLVTKTRSFNENGCDVKLDIEEYVLAPSQGALPKDTRINGVVEESFSNQKASSLLKNDDADDDKDYLTQKIKMLQLRLEDAQKAIDAEKE
jgi:coiled-coil domain-containing protein 102